jgi:Tfp pilus assembly protein PilV
MKDKQPQHTLFGYRSKPVYSDRHAAAFTIVEVLVAAVILAVSVTAAMQLIQSSDKVRARAEHLTVAAQLCANESERIRVAATYYDEIEDSSYTQVRNGATYTVRRRIINDTLETIDDYATREIHISVSMQSDTAELKGFRLLQGYYR